MSATTDSDTNNVNNEAGIFFKGKPFKCQFCESWFSKMGYLKLHQRRHTRENSVLDKHMIMIRFGNKTSFRCGICSKVCAYRASLYRHLRTHANGEHENENRDVSKSNQDICDSDQIQIDEKPFQCNICLSAFLLLEDLQKHLQIHDDKHENNQSNVSQSNQDIRNSDLIQNE